MGNKIPPPAGFGNRLRLAMKEAGLNEAAFAEHVGVDDSTVNRWLSEERFPSWGRLMRSAQTLRCTTDYLLGMPKAEPPPAGRGPALDARAVKRIRRGLSGVAAAARDLAALLPDEDE